MPQGYYGRSAGCAPPAFETYLGGLGTDGVAAVDPAGNAHLAGLTASGNFPLANPFDSTLVGFDPFVSKLNPTGTPFGPATRAHAAARARPAHTLRRVGSR